MHFINFLLASMSFPSSESDFGIYLFQLIKDSHYLQDLTTFFSNHTRNPILKGIHFKMKL